MESENRKLRVIEEVLKLEDDAVLTQIEMLLGNRSIDRSRDKNKPSDYIGCISPESARQLLQQIEQSRNEWERDI